MTWENFYLICFFAGFALSLVSFLSGAFHLHLPVRLHLPQLHHGALHLPNVHVPRAGGSDVPFFNFASLMAFLCWFGGMGYILTHYYGLWFVVALGASTATGLAGAGLVFLFMVKVLLRHERPLDPADFEMLGVVGTLAVPIRENGTGEMIYLQAGTRRVCGARSEDGTAVARGAEVVVTRYERGTAYVRSWEQFAEEHGVASSKTEFRN